MAKARAHKDFELKCVESWNNGKPGGQEYWLVYLDGDKTKPYCGETLEGALEFIAARAALEEPPF